MGDALRFDGEVVFVTGTDGGRSHARWFGGRRGRVERGADSGWRRSGSRSVKSGRFT